jgi:hypothetical protein
MVPVDLSLNSIFTFRVFYHSNRGLRLKARLFRHVLAKRLIRPRTGGQPNGPSTHHWHCDYTDQPIYWFAILDKAVEQGDHATAAEAQRQLELLGVRVRYGRRRQQKAESSE